jgi:CRP/FNR family transcriptional regulator, anaerobic regulatory protein
MITADLFQRAVTSMPFLLQASPQVRREFQQSAVFARIPAGKDVFAEGDLVEGIALLLSGVVRVYKIGETGREITLYRFGLGESCVLTANAILSQKTFPAIATVEEDAEALLVPAQVFSDWVRQHDLWREFVFDLFSQRLALVMLLVDQVVFQHMDRRIAALLINRAQGGSLLRITHQEIASELGSSREVISRLVEDFAAKSILRSVRGTIEILDPEALKTRSLM